MIARAGVLAAALALAGCVTAPPPSAPVALAEVPRFDPFTFFVGESRGEGVLAKVLSDPVPIRVESRGRIEVETHLGALWAEPPRKVLVLDQVVHEGDKPARQRQWRLVEIAPGRYEGTLSDAIGPVAARSEGNRLTITFTIKGGFAVRQELTLSPGGARAANVMRVSKLGVTVAVLSEDIVRGVGLAVPARLGGGLRPVLSLPKEWWSSGRGCSSRSPQLEAAASLALPLFQAHTDFCPKLHLATS